MPTLTGPNRLIREKSPYLLQHAHNPVDWYPWGDEAFEAARREDKPIFLSIGYSTCYWCHVMEREVFENPELARLMNAKLVSIKVDREERPDVDRVYMAAVQAMTGSGGWPMSVFLTHRLQPFYAATYIPPAPRYGRPGFADVVNHLSALWANERTKIDDSGREITAYLNTPRTTPGSFDATDVLTGGFRRFVRSYDPEFSGFGQGTKFPRPAVFNFLFRYFARTGDQTALEISLATLRAMARGGIRDHIGGGFHRYAVDRQWRVPHFEKMLYDQAQLAVSYLEGFQLTGDTQYAAIARDILDYVAIRLRDPKGGFYAAEDAESAPDPAVPDMKEEGAFYLWKREELDVALGSERAAVAAFVYGVAPAGNAPHDPTGVFAGKNILFTEHTLEEAAEELHLTPDEVQKIMDESRRKLMAVRETRPRPSLDDKILTAWNGLMISACARGYGILRENRFLECAIKAAEFVLSELREPGTQHLLRRFRDGEARFEGGLQDYAFLIQGLIDLYEATMDTRWLLESVGLQEEQIRLFRDPSGTGFFDATGNDPSIVLRTKEEYDGAEPSGNSVAAINLIRLSRLTGKEEWLDMARMTIEGFGYHLRDIPEALPQMLTALDLLTAPVREVILVADNSARALPFHELFYRQFLPHTVFVAVIGAEARAAFARFLPVTAGMHAEDGQTRAYVCENFTCQLPASEPGTFLHQLTKVSP